MWLVLLVLLTTRLAGRRTTHLSSRLVMRLAEFLSREDSLSVAMERLLLHLCYVATYVWYTFIR